MTLGVRPQPKFGPLASPPIPGVSIDPNDLVAVLLLIATVLVPIVALLPSWSTPIRYFVIPWSDLIETKEHGGRRGQPLSFKDGTIELRAVQYMNAEMIVELTPSMEIMHRRISDGFWERHAELERNGALKHTRETCPFRNGPTVHEWMPGRGWRELKP